MGSTPAPFIGNDCHKYLKTSVDVTIAIHLTKMCSRFHPPQVMTFYTSTVHSSSDMPISRYVAAISSLAACQLFRRRRVAECGLALYVALSLDIYRLAKESYPEVYDDGQSLYKSGMMGTPNPLSDKVSAFYIPHVEEVKHDVINACRSP